MGEIIKRLEKRFLQDDSFLKEACAHSNEIMTQQYGSNWQDIPIAATDSIMVQINKEKTLKFRTTRSQELLQLYTKELIATLKHLESDFLEALTYSKLKKVLKMISLFKRRVTFIPEVFEIRYIHSGAIRSIDIREIHQTEAWPRTSAYQEKYTEHLDSCLSVAAGLGIIEYQGETQMLMVSHDDNPAINLGSTIVFLNPGTAQELGIPLESNKLEYVQVTLPKVACKQYNKAYFSVIINPEVMLGAILLPPKWQREIAAGAVTVRFLKTLPNPVSLFVHHQFLGGEFNRSLLPENENINIAISKDEFQMQRTVITAGDKFTVLGAGEFSITKIWVMDTQGGPPFELPAVGFMADMEVEIIF